MILPKNAMRIGAGILLALCTASMALAQAVPANYYQELQYRLIGPFRAGRTVGAVGIPDQPNVFFIGVNNGGVWKTDDYGRTWQPIFDEAPTGSVGDIAVFSNRPEVIYVGTGEGLHRPDLSTGDGVFKSTDGGQSWQHMGLGDVQQISRIVVHPDNPDIVFVAGLGHPYGANEERGVFRSTNGGRSWEKVLYINHDTGATQVEFDPGNPDILFASLWEHREGPWENASFSGPNSGLYRSTDGGTSWQPIQRGLPTSEQGLGRIGVAFAPSNTRRMYATVDARQNGGIYRSEDAGLSWSLISNDRRLWGRGSDFAEIKVHPKDPDVVFIANIASYQSLDGGKSWSSQKGAPGGDDYHRIWINPLQPDIRLYAADQGATITVNGGKTWSSWYNQPTSQLYHITTDNEFPYWVYGGQQESGAIGVASRGNGGQISFRDWMGVGADEYAYVAPDPLHPDLIYGGRVVRFNKKTGQTQLVAPEAVRSGQYRILRTMPLLFHPADPTMLLFATNVLWKTHNGGEDWQIISPDLSRPQPEVPESIGDFKQPELADMPRRGVIYAVGPSPLDAKIIWAGTDDGLIQLTQDGGQNWQNVTPPTLRAWDKVSQVVGSHFEKGAAYMAINSIRRDDMRPHIYRTHDGGKNWTHITGGMAADGPVNVVREDPKQAGLLFAGTEREVYFSVDDGDHWQSLRLNMPATSIRDLVIQEDDLVIGTHGRSIWILDNIAPLREMARVAASAKVHLFAPPRATRVRWNMFSDTPLPPEEPAGVNPPDGAILDYYLPAAATKVKLEIFTTDGQLVRAYSSEDEVEQIDSTALPHPLYWIRPDQPPATSAGQHRFVWDLHYTPPPGAARSYSIAAVLKSTPSGPLGPFVAPGTYRVKLTAGDQVMEQNLEVRLDPRVDISTGDLQLQTDYSMACYRAYLQAQKLREAIDALLSQTTLNASRRDALEALRGAGDPGGGDIIYGSIYARPAEQEDLVGLQRKFLYLLTAFQHADAKPTAPQMEGVKALEKVLATLTARWEKLK